MDTKMIEIKEAINTLKKHIGLTEIICDYKKLNEIIDKADRNFDYASTNSSGLLDCSIYGVDLSDSNYYMITERYSDE